MNKPEEISTGDLVRTLQMRGGFELVNQSTNAGQVRVLGRVAPAARGNWLVILHHLLMLGASSEWNVDISKSYFLKGGSIVYGWRLIFQAPELAQHLPSICKAVTDAPRARAIVDEQPLAGAGRDRNAPSAGNRGRGAQSAGKAAVGPAALAQLRQG